MKYSAPALAITFVVALLALSGCTNRIVAENSAPQTETPTADTTIATAPKAVKSTTKTPKSKVVTKKSKTITITYTDKGYAPSAATINTGDRVTFTNKSSVDMWPASAMHPTHNIYPEKGGCIGSKFDACRSVATGTSWGFTFNQVGTWGFHDHINPQYQGKITVQ